MLSAVLLEVGEDLAMLKRTVGYQQWILEYQQRDSRKLNLIISGVKELENENTMGVVKKIFKDKLSFDESIYPSYSEENRNKRKGQITSSVYVLLR